MMAGELTFVHPEAVHLIWVMVAALWCLHWADSRGREALQQFASPIMLFRLATQSGRQRRIFRLLGIGAFMSFCTLGIMRPQSRGVAEAVSVSRISADIVFVLDVSKSMLAEDAAPNRLGRAKAEIADLVGSLSGNRVGLVAFAGRAAVLCPLTPDYGFFKMILSSADHRSIRRGGTRIGDAIAKATRAFGPGEGAKVMMLITDGEDHESFAADAAKKALEKGVSIVAIGFGSEAGSEITLTDPKTGAKHALTDRDGKVVRSRLDGETLREVTRITEGVYIPAGIAALDLGAIVAQHIEPLVQAKSTSSVRVVPTEYYPWMAIGALVSLFAAIWLCGAPSLRRQW